ncbi:MAG: JmjC domain-containing protein [Rubrivivax sp.]
MDVTTPLTLLGGLTAQQFMQKHWQKKPLLVRQALPGVVPPVGRARLFELAGQDDVESRFIAQQPQWQVKHGPLNRRSLPPVAQPGWTVLVQGLDLHEAAAHALLQQFRFVPDARLDDLMVSWASDGGGVGPHLDSYDVFLIQLQGQRRWRIGRVPDASLVPELPLKILQNFQPEEEWLLEPGDMLYLPPKWGHDGVAVGECLTGSVGFRVPSDEGLAAELLQRLADTEELRPQLYRDPKQPATATPAAIPTALVEFAREALEQRLNEPGALHRALGEVLSEPKPKVWFSGQGGWAPGQGVRLDARTRMLYDEERIFINGESFDASGRDAKLMRQLADARQLDAAALKGLSAGAAELLAGWVDDGWLHAVPAAEAAVAPKKR